MIKGYKGFDKDLKCRGFQYEIGKTYEIPEESLRICSNGFHYCDNFKDVTCFYSFNDRSNRYCEIEILGKIITEGNKSVSNIIKIVKEIKDEELILLKVSSSSVYKTFLQLYEQNPNIVLGGSLALVLQGIDIGRNPNDLDLVIPFWFNFTDGIIEEQQYPSNNDFNYCFTYKNIKCDVKIDTHQRYINVKNGDITIKVAPFYEIIAAKCKYAKTNKKHETDLKYMLDIQ